MNTSWGRTERIHKVSQTWACRMKLSLPEEHSGPGMSGRNICDIQETEELNIFRNSKYYKKNTFVVFMFWKAHGNAYKQDSLKIFYLKKSKNTYLKVINMLSNFQLG